MDHLAPDTPTLAWMGRQAAFYGRILVCCGALVGLVACYLRIMA